MLEHKHVLDMLELGKRARREEGDDGKPRQAQSSTDVDTPRSAKRQRQEVVVMPCHVYNDATPMCSKMYITRWLQNSHLSRLEKLLDM